MNYLKQIISEYNSMKDRIEKASSIESSIYRNIDLKINQLNEEKNKINKQKEIEKLSTKTFDFNTKIKPLVFNQQSKVIKRPVIKPIKPIKLNDETKQKIDELTFQIKKLEKERNKILADSKNIEKLKSELILQEKKNSNMER